MWHKIFPCSVLSSKRNLFRYAEDNGCCWVRLSCWPYCVCTWILHWWQVSFCSLCCRFVLQLATACLSSESFSLARVVRSCYCCERCWLPVCHTRDPHLKRSSYRNAFCAILHCVSEKTWCQTSCDNFVNC